MSEVKCIKQWESATGVVFSTKKEAEQANAEFTVIDALNSVISVEDAKSVLRILKEKGWLNLAVKRTRKSREPKVEDPNASVVAKQEKSKK